MPKDQRRDLRRKGSLMIDQLKVEKKDDDSILTESDNQIDTLDSLVPDNAGNSSSI